MSQQNGGFHSLASIEAGSRNHGIISSNSHPSTSSVPLPVGHSTASQSSSSSRSGTISSRVHIPKLSAATTELLARVAQNIRGTQQKPLLKDDQTPVNCSPFSPGLNWNGPNTQSRRARTMRVSSTFIELPTAPFESSDAVETAVVSPSPVPESLPSVESNGTSLKPSETTVFNPSSAPASLSSDGNNGASVRLPDTTVVNSDPAPASSSPTGMNGDFVRPFETTVPNLSPAPSPSSPCSAINAASVKPSGLANVAPKPALECSTSRSTFLTLEAPTESQRPSGHQTPSPVPLTSTAFPTVPNNLFPARAQAERTAVEEPTPTSTSFTLETPTGAQPQTEPQPRPPLVSLPSEILPTTSNIRSVAEAQATNTAIERPAPASTSVVLETLTGVQPPSVPQPPPEVSLAPTAVPKISDNSSIATGQAAKTAKTISAPPRWRSTGNGRRRSQKRKRGRGDDDEDIIRAGDSSSDESDNTPAATQTKSGRQVNRPSLYVPPPLSPATPQESNNTVGGGDKSQEARKRKRIFRKGKNTNINCIYCQRGHSPPNNAIVFCDECNGAWHQHCHDPPIASNVITVKEKEWLCRECKPSKIVVLRSAAFKNPNRTIRPPVHSPFPPRADVGGEGFSTDARRRYLSCLSHASLVELLLTISDKQPTVPMFPENLRSLPSSKFPFTEATATTMSMPTVREDNTGQLTINPAPQVIRGRYYEESSDDESEYEFHEHRLYPRAGNGVRLSDNTEDLDILQEDPACPTFSYALHAHAHAIVNDGVLS